MLLHVTRPSVWINAAKIPRRKPNGFLVESHGRGNGGALGGKKHRVGESRTHQVDEQSTAIPTLECWPANTGQQRKEPYEMPHGGEPAGDYVPAKNSQCWCEEQFHPHRYYGANRTGKVPNPAIDFIPH